MNRINNITGCILAEEFIKSNGTLAEDFKVSGLLLPKDKVSRNGVLYDWESAKAKGKKFEGKTVNYNHIIDDDKPPVGKVDAITVKEEDDEDGVAGLYYELSIDENSEYADSIKKGYLNKVSLQVTADAQKEEVDDDGNSYTRAWIKDPLEISIVKVPGYDETTMEVAIAEAFKTKSKAGVDDGNINNEEEGMSTANVPVRTKMAGSEKEEAVDNICGKEEAEENDDVTEEDAKELLELFENFTIIKGKRIKSRVRNGWIEVTVDGRTELSVEESRMSEDEAFKDVIEDVRNGNIEGLRPKKGLAMKRKSLIKNKRMKNQAGEIEEIEPQPDGTGPHGRGLGPGKGKADGSGLEQEYVEPLPESEADPEQLKMGIKVEMEHTDDPAEAKVIALQHLAELPDYYTRLKKMEEKFTKKAVDVYNKIIAKNKNISDGDLVTQMMNAGVPNEDAISVINHTKGWASSFKKEFKAGDVVDWYDMYTKRTKKLKLVKKLDGRRWSVEYPDGRAFGKSSVNEGDLKEFKVVDMVTVLTDDESKELLELSKEAMTIRPEFTTGIKNIKFSIDKFETFIKNGDIKNADTQLWMMIEQAKILQKKLKTVPKESFNENQIGPMSYEQAKTLSQSLNGDDYRLIYSPNKEKWFFINKEDMDFHMWGIKKDAFTAFDTEEKAIEYLTDTNRVEKLKNSEVRELIKVLKH